ncbi:MAG: phage antirepressor [Muribaculaceae bacterium]|nr:phage antirepressor [Muribaculaceae bacterium]
MKNNIQIFQNSQFGEVRVIIADNNEPMFCLADVCMALGIQNHRNVKARLDEDDVRLMDTIDNLGRNQKVTYISESGLYMAILRSEAEKAKPFRKWVTSDVLPSIRKHGGYLTSQKIEEALLNPDVLIRLATNLKEERQKRLEAEQAKMIAEKINKENEPKVLFYDSVTSSNTVCLVKELATILNQNGCKNIGQNRLFSWLRKNGYLGTRGEYYNMPTQRAMDLELFKVTKGTRVDQRDGSVITTRTTKVTTKGLAYFIDKFLGNKSN